MGALGNFFGDLKVLLAAATAKPPAPNEIASFGLLAEQNAAVYPNEVAIICEGETVTWQDLNQRANRVASFLAEQGVGHGDCVSLFMQNRIEFVVQLIGITKLGAIGGLINTNLIKVDI